MLRWLDIIKFVTTGNPIPDKRIEKSDQEWKNILTKEQYSFTRKKAGEKKLNSESPSFFEAEQYNCVCCNTLLFDSDQKLNSNSTLPIFSQPIKKNTIAYHKDRSFGFYQIEATCNTCDAHLGHVYRDDSVSGSLRYCINIIALKRINHNLKKATFGGGCFWCTEAVFEQLKGVEKVENGYSGGKISNPTYREVSSGITGHAEVIQFTYNPNIISYADLIKIHLTTHDPTITNTQATGTGSQYRSVIFYRNKEEKETAMKVIKEIQEKLEDPINTELVMFKHFFLAEEYHQNYYNNNKDKNVYCSAIINPKLRNFKKLYQDKLK
ncbi:peptide-methionine (S)-S-oxide reductase MsrA [Flavobacterium oreochromis]|uniref:Peptide methionine sulfoxide reductase MsrA n=1 Tax=Flavobacterium columnare TaxID=996 RepID=A0A246G847_9FLAO|nr:peptide-methionine (S)-S-oxide reductase MsrA [Flavobacterium oreochromis]OWP74934.1 protein-methionine-S-oxide reductase [Flavobacterium oreochromis]